MVFGKGLRKAKRVFETRQTVFVGNKTQCNSWGGVLNPPPPTRNYMLGGGQAPTLSGTQEEESQGVLGLSGLRSLSYILPFFTGSTTRRSRPRLSADRAGGAQARSLPNSNDTRLLTAD